MREKIVASEWLDREGRRLDCGPYVSGALEARLALEKLSVDKDPLRTLVSGHDGGIYNGPHFARNYVIATEHGVPFLTSSDMLEADLSRVPLLSKKDATSPRLNFLRIEPGMILISCSGTIGRMIYARPDMAGIWSSQDILKIVPNPSRIPGGYLYSLLASRYGIPLVVGGTYGSVIEHIEPAHVTELPVPRLGDELEKHTSNLIGEAAELRSKYQLEVMSATKMLFESVGLQDITPKEWSEGKAEIGFSRKLKSSVSLRSLNFHPRFEDLCASIRKGPSRPLGALCKPGTLRRAGRYKRIDASPEFSYQLIAQKEIFWFRPEGRWIAKKSVGTDLLVEPGTTLVAARGTLGESEMYCRSEFVWGPNVERAYSEDFLRVVSDESILPRGCLYAFMRSETAFRMLRSVSMGTKLQDHHPTLLSELPVPYPSEQTKYKVHDLVVKAYEKREKSVALEDEAIGIVEAAIEGGA